jgi:hypothetical protein
VIGGVPDIADTGPAQRFESIVGRYGLCIGHNLRRSAAPRNGSNPARTRVITMIRLSRAEIFALPLPLRVFQGCDIDHEPVFHLTFDRALIGLFDLLDRNHFDVRRDIVVGAVIQHFLSLGYPADHRPS